MTLGSENRDPPAGYPWVDLFSYDAGSVTFIIRTGPETFDISLVRRNHSFWLFRDDAAEPIQHFLRPYDAVIAVADHRTGWEEWDACAIKVSNYICDWRGHIDDRRRVRMIAEWIERSRSPSFRELDEFFHLRYSYAMDRMKIRDLLRDMMLTGQVDKPISAYCAPAEFDSLARLAEKWGMT